VLQKFPRACRLHQRVEFERALKNKALLNKWFALYTERNAVTSERLGIIVSKRIVSRAVDRNRLKRIVRETFRRNADANKTPADIVVRVRVCPSNEDMMEFRSSLTRLLMKMRMTQNDAPVSSLY